MAFDMTKPFESSRFSTLIKP